MFLSSGRSTGEPMKGPRWVGTQAFRACHPPLGQVDRNAARTGDDTSIRIVCEPLPMGEFDCRPGISIMASDRNSKAKQIIKPNFLNGPSFSVGDDKFGLRFTERIHDC